MPFILDHWATCISFREKYNNQKKKKTSKNTNLIWKLRNIFLNNRDQKKFNGN